MYNRQLILYKGIDNAIQFRLLNADQKPVDVTNYTPIFVAFDENKRQIIEHTATQLFNDDSAATRGLFEVKITENDLLNIDSQYLSYNVYLRTDDNERVLTYSDSHFGGCGTIYVDDCQFPGPLNSYTVSAFTEDGVDSGNYNSEPISAEPAINGNEALHTAAIYTNGYIGDVTVQTTLESQLTGEVFWADVATLSFTGSETEPTPINFNGVFSFIRFHTSADPANTITKILVRN